MANAPGGKSVGRVTIRVIPDTSKFRDDLKVSLERIEQATNFTVNVNKANVDVTKIREDIKRQIEGISNLKVDAMATAIIDQVQLRKTEVRQSLQNQLNDMGLMVKLTLDDSVARHDVDSLVNHINRQQGTINVNAATAAATTQMRWLTRTRFVDIVPTLNQAALARIESQLLALTGIRVAADWTDDILKWVEEIDRKLPKIGMLTSAIGALISVLLASVSGVLMLGAGLASLAPLLLILPGLILGTGFAITTLITALRTGKQELSSIAPYFHELADIIQNTYWDAAREPITRLITNLMPQLRVAFEGVSGALGRFTGAFADAFERQLAGGKLEYLFAGISKSFDILSTGTDAFAGALVSLSAVAAKYVPRLAQWFVDISIQFDTWLKGVAEDGRLDSWMERGIKSLKDFGRAIAGISEQFYYLWKAAYAGGSGGISGFADTMQRWADIMASPKFQSATTSIFRGANEAMGALGNAFKSLGNMIYALQWQIEFALGATGRVIGDLVSAIADAMKQPAFVAGFYTFFSGFEKGMQQFNTYMPDIMKGVGALLQLAGDLALQLGPILGAALGGLGKAIEPLVKFISESILPWLGPMVTGIVTVLGNMLTWLFTNVLPAFQQWWATYIEAPFQAFWEKYGPGITSAWQGIIDKIVEFAKAVWPLVVEAFTWVSDFVSQNVLPVLDKLGAWFTDPKNKAQIELFTNVVKGLVVVFMAIPLAIGLIIGALVWLAAWLVDTGINISNFVRDVNGMFHDMGANLYNWFAQRLNAVVDFLNAVIEKYNELPFDDISLIAKVGYQPVGDIPGAYKGGTVVKKGTVLVGERGPELLNLDAGASIIPLDKTGTGQTINYYAAPNASLDSEQQLFTAMRRAKVYGW